jgi:hypothetical protein
MFYLVCVVSGRIRWYLVNSTASALQDKLDLFVATHFFGWWLKTVVLRDWWLCTVLSVMFEVLEYTLEHQLPNFSECWWDHVSNMTV